MTGVHGCFSGAGDRRIVSGLRFDIAAADRLFYMSDAGWSSLVARQAHNLKVRGSNPLPATTNKAADFK